MWKFNAYKWNEWEKDYRMLILTEEDVENDCKNFYGRGWEIVILPSKYKDVESKHLYVIRMVTKARGGEIIYV